MTDPNNQTGTFIGDVYVPNGNPSHTFYHAVRTSEHATKPKDDESEILPEMVEELITNPKKKIGQGKK